MKAFVTGATGFIGAALVRQLVATGTTVRALVRPGSDPPALHSPSIEVVRGDMRNRADVERGITGCDVAFHLAVDRNSRESILSGVENVAEAATQSGVSRIVFTSSAGVYRRLRHGVVDESTPIGPDRGYHSFQAEAERILIDSSTRGTPVVIARVTSLGPGGPTWLGVYQAIAAGRFRMIGGGKNHYQPIDVTDLAEYLIRCGTTSGIEGRIYILAGRRAYTLRNIVGLIEEELGVRTSDSIIPISALRVYRLLNEWMLAGTGRSLPRQDRAAFFLYDRSFDISRSLNELAYTPEIPLEETIRRTVATYRERGWLPQSTPPLP